jgi:hypothetical protein
MLARTLAALIPVSLVALATLDCGGQIDPNLLPACPSDGTCTSDCKQTVTDCAGAHELACTCDSTGHAQCPELGAPQCQNDCDALMQGQSACSIEGETCVAPMQNSCIDAPTLYCTCESGQFFCPAPPMDCPKPACPPPDQVKPGATCAGVELCDTTQSVTDCDGNVVGVVECSCVGGTFGDCISPPVPVCVADGGTPDGG